MNRHDRYFKICLEYSQTREEMLEEYLPDDIKSLVDIKSCQLEKESFIEKNHRQYYSDVLLSMKHQSKKQYMYLLAEHQSTNDNMMAFRMMRYILLICDMHMKKYKTQELPLIYPLILYHNDRKYTAARSFWNLFTHPDLAKKYIAGDYQVIDICRMDDNDCMKSQYLGLMQYMFKHGRNRNIINIFEKLVTILEQELQITLKDLPRDYLVQALWYNTFNMTKEQESGVDQFFTQQLNDEGDSMTSLTQIWKAEGVKEGMQQGIQTGIKQGMLEKTIQIAKNMLAHNLDIDSIANVTGLSKSKIIKMKKEESE